MTEDVRRVIADLDDANARGIAAEVTRDAERTRADDAVAECARLRAEHDCTVAVLRHLADGMTLDHAYPALAGVPVEVADALRAVVRQRDDARERHGAMEECADVFRRERDDALADAARLRAIYDAVDELAFRDHAAEVESYCETVPGSHAAAQARAGDAYDALMRLRDAERERRIAAGEGP